MGLVNDVGAVLLPGDAPFGGIVEATFDTSLNKFMITSLVPSQTLTQVQANALYDALGAATAAQAAAIAAAALDATTKANAAQTAAINAAALDATAKANAALAAAASDATTKANAAQTAAASDATTKANAAQTAAEAYADGISVVPFTSTHDITSALAFGTPRTNSTGKPLFLAINTTNLYSGTYYDHAISLTVGSFVFTTSGGSGADPEKHCFISMMIPAGASYTLTFAGGTGSPQVSLATETY